MPWFPDFVGAAQLARGQSLAAGLADPAGRYVSALNSGDPHVIEDIWPGQVVVYDPRAGELRGHKWLRDFVRRSQEWLAGAQARIETVASTAADGRAVVELLVHLNLGGKQVDWPVAIVTESPNERAVVFRSYYCQRAVDAGHHHYRPPVRDTVVGDAPKIVRDFRAALADGDVEAVIKTFAVDGSYREPFSPQFIHRGAAELRSYFQDRFAAGGIDLEVCAVTDDGVRCAAEYNCVGWGNPAMSPQAGVAIFEPNDDGLIAAIRVYDDLDESPPQS